MKLLMNSLPLQITQLLFIAGSPARNHFCDREMLSLPTGVMKSWTPELFIEQLTVKHYKPHQLFLVVEWGLCAQAFWLTMARN